MNRKFTYLILVWTLLISSSFYAQIIKGTVTDATGPLPMVNVSVKGTSVSTQADISGEYSIPASTNSVLVFSYIGYQTKEMAVNGQSVVNVTLTEDTQSLKEVVITGYVGQSRRSISGAVTQVDVENIAKTRVADVSQMLQGQVAGVFVAASTGAPGDGIQLRVRGVGTLGNSDVLYVIDGVPTRSIATLNQSDIKTMTVLKDAASASIYGSRAAGGVIVITTKRGSEGKGSIEAEVFSGIQFATNLPKMLNTYQYLTVKDIAWHNTIGNAPDAISPYGGYLPYANQLPNTDWQDELFTNGLTKNIQVSASGGNDKVTYLISGGLFESNGIVVENNDTYKRTNFRVNLNGKVTDRFTVGTNLQATYINQDKLSSSGDAPGVIRNALIRPPIIPVFKDPADPTYSANDPYTDLPFYYGPNGGWNKNFEFGANPIALVHFTQDERNWFQLFGNVYADYDFLKDKSLKFRSNLGVDARFLHNKAFRENFGDPNIASPDDPYYNLGRQNRPNNLTEDRGQDVTFTWSNTLNYVKNFGDHSVNALLGSEFIQNKFANIGGSRYGYDLITDNYRYLDYGDTTGSIYPRQGTSGNASYWSLLSYFGSATYGYKDKIFLTGTMRADASSRFGPNNRWGYFPSVAGNYILSNESFMKEASWLSILKLRASWGQNGNQEIPNDAFRTFVTVGVNGTDVLRFENPDLKWETTTQTNFGLDLGLFQNRLNISADYFNKVTDGILLAVVPPRTTAGSGIQGTYFNSAEVENKGFEFLVNWQDNTHEFRYGLSANLATLKNEVQSLNKYVPNLQDDVNHTRTVVGQPINAYYGYEFIGIYQNQAEVDSYLYSNANGRLPGDMKFRDVNGDGQINADDRTFIGNPIPEYTYGVSFNASYKGFDISFLFQGVENVDRYNDLKQILNFDSRPFNSTTDVLGSWSGEGTSNTQPRLTFNNNGGGEVSSALVEDASYLRLKNLEVGYTFSRWVKGFDTLRLYLSGQNLLTWTDYSGLDPESTLLKDQGTYPQSTSILFGARIKI